MSNSNVSFHGLDVLGRAPQILQQIGSKRKIAASDSELTRFFNRYLLIPDNLPLLVFRSIQQMLPIRPARRMLIIDGSGQASKLFSVAALDIGTPFLAGLERIPKTGKELDSSRSLLKRMIRDAGDLFDFVVLDGLYYDQTTFKLALEAGKHACVKTKEENLEIVQHTESVFRIDLVSNPKSPDQEWNYDMERMVKFRVFAIRRFENRDAGLVLDCFRVEEHDLKKESNEVFYLVTTAPDLTLFEARTIAKRRWQIETGIFRNGNQNFKAKLWRNRDETCARQFLLLLYTLMSMFLLLYAQAMEQKEINPHTSNLRFYLAFWIVTKPELTG